MNGIRDSLNSLKKIEGKALDEISFKCHLIIFYAIFIALRD